MNEMQAVIELIREARRDRGTVTRFKRTRRALVALGFNTEDQATIFAHLDYYSPDTRQPYTWLAARLAEQEQ